MPAGATSHITTVQIPSIQNSIYFYGVLNLIKRSHV